VSHEAIYLSLFVQSRGALRRELEALPAHGSGDALPTWQAAAKDVGSCATPSIQPATGRGGRRAVPGHWEGDLVLGKRPSAVGTLVERRSRYVVLFPLPEGFTAQRMRPALTAAVLQLPEQLRRSLNLGSRQGDGRAPARDVAAYVKGQPPVASSRGWGDMSWLRWRRQTGIRVTGGL
jgi:IS30 family transposase